jgi:hypothetical protein
LSGKWLHVISTALTWPRFVSLASWMIHITCWGDIHFYSIDPPSNAPIIVKATGAVRICLLSLHRITLIALIQPPIEDPRHEFISVSSSANVSD